MKRLFVSLMIVFAVGVCFAQTIELTPMTFDSYKLHKSEVDVVEVSSVPNWSPSKKPSYMHSMVHSYITEENNWVKLQDFLNEFHSLSSDNDGNIWVIKSYWGKSSTPLFILNKKISSPEDVNGVYWVSWKLIPGSKDIYPVLNPE